MSPAYAAKLANRRQAAIDEERARQQAREAGRYGRGSSTDMVRVRAAEQAFDLATAACWSPA